MRRWVPNVLLAAGVTVAMGVVLEVALRVAGISYPAFARPDPCCGSTLRPHASGHYTREGDAWVSINSRGLRGDEVALDKPPGVYRVSVLGDSYTLAMEVDEHDTFLEVAERALESCAALGGRRPEVLNFGVSGYGTAQELLVYREHARAFRPDAVVIAFLTGNDVRNNLEALDGTAVRPYFVLEDGELVLDASFREEPAFRRRQTWWWRAFASLSDASHLLQLTNEAFNRRRSERTAGDRLEGLGAELGLDSAVYREPEDERMREAWRVTERILETAAAEVVADGARLLVMTLSNGVQVHPDPEVRRRFAASLGVPDLLYPERRLDALAKRASIPLLSLAPGLQEWASEHRRCVHGFPNAVPCGGHWNADGHQLAGEALARELCAREQSGWSK